MDSLLLRNVFTKIKVKRGATVSLVLLGLLTPCSAFSSDKVDDGKSYSWGLGLGVSSTQNAYVNIDRDYQPFPMVTFDSKYVQISGTELALKLPSYYINPSNNLNFSIIGRYEFDGYKQDDAKILNGMEDRDGGFWSGFKAEWENSFANVSAEYTSEVSGDSEGSKFNFGVERTWQFKESFMLTPRVVVSFLDDKYVDYYYGVRQNEVNVNRAYYNGESGVNLEVGTRGGYMFKQKHFLFLDVGVKSLASEIKDSPLIDSSTENSVAFGYIYNF